ncbi:glycosyltransferase [Nitrosococcus wardiae]|uniref:Glycosyltransferase n=1 Tax=Nitrosococcus wardiae TaxID=1814290 RepID=A0A4P7BZ08_9GAMM|nr:glycosyltransferase [Nitrosococcus wardiae]QBQ54499.1 glycosyltransferase [Nitrosococcus wardiae]
MSNTVGHLISVIMPCYNGACYLKRAVSSVLEQHYQNVELIVINDGSTDNSLEILAEINDPRLKVISQQSQGVCAARNRGLALASGEYIAFLDVDDTWHPDCLNQLYMALQGEPQAALAYCGWQNVGLPGHRGEPFVPPDYEVHNKAEILLEGCRWPIHATLTKKEEILAAGQFDERFSTSEDYLLWLRIATFSKIVCVPEVLAFYHFHSGPQATKDVAGTALSRWSVKQTFLREHPEVLTQLGKCRIRELADGKLLEEGYACYWRRDLQAAHTIFRMVMKRGYGSLRDWKYMLPAWFPLTWYTSLIGFLEREDGSAP